MILSNRLKWHCAEILYLAEGDVSLFHHVILVALGGQVTPWGQIVPEVHPVGIVEVVLGHVPVVGVDLYEGYRVGSNVDAWRSQTELKLLGNLHLLNITKEKWTLTILDKDTLKKESD